MSLLVSFHSHKGPGTISDNFIAFQIDARIELRPLSRDNAFSSPGFPVMLSVGRDVIIHIKARHQQKKITCLFPCKYAHLPLFFFHIGKEEK